MYTGSASGAGWEVNVPAWGVRESYLTVLCTQSIPSWSYWNRQKKPWTVAIVPAVTVWWCHCVIFSFTSRNANSFVVPLVSLVSHVQSSGPWNTSSLCCTRLSAIMCYTCLSFLLSGFISGRYSATADSGGPAGCCWLLCQLHPRLRLSFALQQQIPGPAGGQYCNTTQTFKQFSTQLREWSRALGQLSSCRLKGPDLSINFYLRGPASEEIWWAKVNLLHSQLVKGAQACASVELCVSKTHMIYKRPTAPAKKRSAYSADHWVFAKRDLRDEDGVRPSVEE